MVIRVLGILCVGVAHQSNKSTQLEITNAEAFVTLVHLLRTFSVPLIQVGFFAYLFNFFGFFLFVLDTSLLLIFRNLNLRG